MSISTLRRQVKNVALNYTDAQVKVREATSNDPWGPTTALMSEIADMTHNPMQFTEIMTMIWKRLNDHGKNWRHVYKSLVLLDYLIKCGNERVAQQCKENIFSIETLKDFQHIEDNRDQGLNVRTKAKQMVTLLQDEEKLKNERARFMLTRKRFIQNGSTGISSDGTRRSTSGRQRTIDSATIADPEFEEARPSSLGEEEMQLQIALALSREECEKEQELRRGDDIRLQIAIEESKRESTAARSSSLGTPADADTAEKPSTSKSQGALNDLLSLGLNEIFSQDQTSTVVATGPSTSAQAFGTSQNDPWSPRPSTTIPMLDKSVNAFSAPAPALIPPPVQNDPWAPVTELTPVQLQHTQPISSSLNMKPQQELDELLQLTSPVAAAPIAQNDPWAAFEATTSNKSNGSDLAFGNGQQQIINNMGQQRNNVKTPESFLGENSALVNLDNLLGPTNSNIQPKKAAPTNPFLIGTTASAVAATKNNPFMANERPSPSLNEMMQAKQQQGIPETNNAARSSATLNSPFGPDGSLI